MANGTTAAFAIEHGQVRLVEVDPCPAECVGIHAALQGTRHEALEPSLPGVTERFGEGEKEDATGWIGGRWPHNRNRCRTRPEVVRPKGTGRCAIALRD